MRKRLPIGYDNFEQIRTEESYYVDKTLFIKELIDKRAQVNLFTRPRRFGKTLNLSMIKSYFEKSEKDTSYLFDGLAIMELGEAYTKYMGEYPVISVALKRAKKDKFEDCIEEIKIEFAREFKRHSYLLESDLISEHDKEKIKAILTQTASKAEWSDNLRFLSECLYTHHGKKTIILIDEYDVPLENAYFHNFYDEMIGFIRTLFESALKTNEFLEFAVMTGCLRISKESIFTGMNNLKIISILTPGYGEYFGFTEPEVETMLKDYGIESKTDEARKWYNGYIFGNTTVYNPWSVLNYVDLMWTDIKQFPRKFWGNTSSNDIVRTLIDNADMTDQSEIEKLIAGGCITKPIQEEVTYGDILKKSDNLWNFLLFAGYLKKVSETFVGRTKYAELKIPNEEVCALYEDNILEWFGDSIKQKAESKDLEKMYTAVMAGDAEVFQEELGELLAHTISFMDNAENFYHGFLLGTLSMMEGCLVKSNRESGNGRSDIYIKRPVPSKGAVVLELKTAREYDGLSDKCDEAIRQIEEKEYTSELEQDGYKNIIKYGVAFYKKSCMIKMK